MENLLVKEDRLVSVVVFFSVSPVVSVYNGALIANNLDVDEWNILSNSDVFMAVLSSTY